MVFVYALNIGKRLVVCYNTSLSENKPFIHQVVNINLNFHKIKNHKIYIKNTFQNPLNNSKIKIGTTNVSLPASSSCHYRAEDL